MFHGLKYIYVKAISIYGKSRLTSLQQIPPWDSSSTSTPPRDEQDLIFPNFWPLHGKIKSWSHKV